jgi:maltose-binding protein MalE
MTIESNSEQIEISTSEILNENNPVVAESVDVAVEPAVKKKAAPRKKTAAKSSESKVKKPAVKRSRSTKVDGAESTPPAPVMKAFWGVFNPMMVQVAQYNYADETEARKAAADMTEKKKTPHFVQLIKKVI